jgi:hypothetical protein
MSRCFCEFHEASPTAEEDFGTIENEVKELVTELGTFEPTAMFSSKAKYLNFVGQNAGSNTTRLIELLEAGEELPLFFSDNVNDTDWCDQTPLIVCATTGNTRAAEALIKAKADLDAQTKWGYTAVITAVANGHLEILNLLMRNGADGAKANSLTGETPQAMAERRGALDMVSALETDLSDKLTKVQLNAVKEAVLELASQPDAFREVLEDMMKDEEFAKLFNSKRE